MDIYVLDYKIQNISKQVQEEEICRIFVMIIINISSIVSDKENLTIKIYHKEFYIVGVALN